MLPVSYRQMAVGLQSNLGAVDKATKQQGKQGFVLPLVPLNLRPAGDSVSIFGGKTSIAVQNRISSVLFRGVTAQKQADFPDPLHYPRPQFRRKEWMSLDGPWEFQFDRSNIGLEEGWFRKQALDKMINVPFAYQTALSGINDKGIYDVIWYRREFEVPKDWRGKDLLLHFNAVDYYTTVWVNGQPVGRNKGGHVPFAFNIAPYIRDGKNQITLRVEDRQDADQPRGKQAINGKPEVIDYFCTSGVWQSVWLEPVPKVRIADLKVIPQTKGNIVELEIPLHAPAIGWQVEAEAFDNGKPVALASEDQVGGVARFRLKIPHAKKWTPDNPNLYDLRLRLKDKEGNLIDEVASYFGIRTVGVRNGKVILNGKPVFLKMVLDQGYWPQSNITPPSIEALKKDVAMIKAFGFNGVRKHQKVEDPRWLYLCDKEGLMVWGEMPNARAWSPEMEDRLENEMIRSVRRDYNHPSIIAWVPLNESWGMPDLWQGDPRQYALMEHMVNAIRREDPTRLVVDNDGWEQSSLSDVIGIHDYSKTAVEFRKKYGHYKPGDRLPNRVPGRHALVLARDAEHRGQPVIFTEMGGFLEIPPEKRHDQLDPLYNSYGTFRTPQELLTKYRELVSGIASLPVAAGFCYTQLTDVEQEMNGLMTYDRRPKVDPAAIAEIHRTVFKRQDRQKR